MMTMIQLEFTPEEKEQLHNLRFNHIHPRVQILCEALWLKSLNVPHQTICLICQISSPTLVSYFRMFQDKRISGLEELNFYTPTSELHNFTEKIKSHFEENPARSIKEAVQTIAEITGLKRGVTQVREYFKSIGLSYRKVGMVPAKADHDEQKEYLEKTLEPCLDEAK